MKTQNKDQVEVLAKMINKWIYKIMQGQEKLTLHQKPRKEGQLQKTSCRKAHDYWK